MSELEYAEWLKNLSSGSDCTARLFVLDNSRGCSVISQIRRQLLWLRLYRKLGSEEVDEEGQKVVKL